MGLGDLLSDVAHPLRIVHHPGRFLEDFPGGHFLETTTGKVANDLFSAVENAPGGLVYLATVGPQHPLRVLEQMASATYQDIRHPLRHPGFTALDLLGLEGAIGGTVGRIGAIGSTLKTADIASQGADVASSLERAAQRGLISPDIASKEAATISGKTQAYNRLVNTDTGEFNPFGKRLAQSVLFGPTREERLLFPQGMESIDTPEGLAQHGWVYSKDPFIKAAQKLVDKAYDTLPETRVAPIWRLLTGPVGPLRSSEQRIQSAVRAWQLGIKKEAGVEGQQFLTKHSELMNPINWMVVRMVGEGTRPSKLLEMHQKILDEGKLAPRLVAETKQRMEIIREAANMVEERQITGANGRVRTVPVLKEEFKPQLEQFINDARDLSNARTHSATLSGVLNEETALGRTVGPHTLVETGALPPNLDYMERRLAQIRKIKGKEQEVADLERQINEYKTGVHDEHSHDAGAAGGPYFQDVADIRDFVKQAGLFRIPYSAERTSSVLGSLTRPFRRSYAGRTPRIPGTFTHPFEAAILKGGGGRQDVARLLAESYTEAQRFIALKAIHNRLLATALDTPESIPPEFRQLIRDPHSQAANLGTYETALRRITGNGAYNLLKKEGRLTPQEAVAGGRLFEGVRNALFPDKEEVTAQSLGLSDQEFAELMGDNQEFRKVPGYKWIDKRMLGDLYKKNPLTFLNDYSIGRKALRVIDTVNTAVKSALLFLRPAYIVPNALGNIALNLIQQGMLAPLHMGANLRLWLKMSEGERNLAKIQMGEGSELARYGVKPGEGISGKIGYAVTTGSEKAAQFYNRLVDTPFRINAWVYEARRAGYTTTAEIKKLLNDPALEDERIAIANSANDEIINFERMGPGEEAFLRRLILFYPFTRGASRYAINFYKEHPLAAGTESVIGQQGTQRSEELLGPLPSYLEGLIPLQGTPIGKVPFLGGAGQLVANPSSFSIQGEPAHLGRQALNLITAHPNIDLAFGQNLAPVDQALLSVLTGGGSSPFGKPGAPIPALFEQEAFGSIPAISFAHSLTGQSAIGGDPELSVFPDTDLWHAISRFAFLGALQPRGFNSDLANYRRYQEVPATYPED